MDRIWHGILDALATAGSMTWQVTWSLILGFTLSAIVQALVRKSTVARLLTDDSLKSLATATGLGAASSSCSYAAVALARALFRKSADFTAAMDMSVTENGNFWRRLASPSGFTAVAHTFVMEWAAVIRDVIVGLLMLAPRRHGYQTPSGSTCFSAAIPLPRNSGAL